MLSLVFFSACTSPSSEEPPPSTEGQAKYVGDETCAGCHESIYMSYHRTGMGKSVSLFDPQTAPEAFSSNTEVYHPETGYYYEPYVQNDTLFQAEYLKDADGNTIHERVHAIDWVVGSGNATRSYFMDVNGYITQMPLTWYAESKKWDLSPAYEQNNLRFSRPIGPECMTCHNALPAHSPFTQNHYTHIPTGISCERCHGPGSQHVNLRQAGLGPVEGSPDESIVNPSRLDRELNLSVCQQCHLTGITVFKPGEAMHTFQPGTLLSEHRSVFATEEQLVDPERFGISSHASRLARSACYQESEMTCITCHDPHTPVAELESDYLNQSCRSCHSADEASLESLMCIREGAPAPEEQDLSNCTSCHMQKSGTSDIPHVTFTDHWIRRELPPPRKPEDIDRTLTRTAPFKLVRSEGTDASEHPADMLEEGIAYFKFYETRHGLADYLQDVIRLIRTAMASGADHPEGRIALGRALIEMDSLKSAEEFLATSSLRYPQNAHIQYWLGYVYAETGNRSLAITAFQQAVNLSPEFIEARLKLAIQHSYVPNLYEAEQELLEVIRRDSLNFEAWNNLGFLYLRQQDRISEALPYFLRATELDPLQPIAWANAGSVYLFNGDVEQARISFQRALDADPNYVPAIGNLAQVYWQMNKPEEARSMLRRLLQLNPGDRRALMMLDQWQ